MVMKIFKKILSPLIVVIILVSIGGGGLLIWKYHFNRAIGQLLEKNKEQGKTEWNDCIKEYVKKGIKTFDIKSSFWLGINTVEELENAKEKIKHFPEL